jgi:hypothetical protein
MYSAFSGVTAPGHDGYPPAFVPINWTVSKDHFRNQVPKALDRPIAIFVAAGKFRIFLKPRFYPTRLGTTRAESLGGGPSH